MGKTELSKVISYILRHAPEEYTLKMDNEGWVDIDILIEVIKIKHVEFGTITHKTILDLVNSFDKKRHEIKGNRIRALYGHSLENIIKKDIVSPPTILYHGTVYENYLKIKKTGIKKMQRQYVHLSENIEQAKIVAYRRTSKPIILEIKANEAYNNGVNFYKEGEVWLSDDIPPDFIILT
ncbi:MAG TPA: RNA 2'-phosphotransferase [Bacteroidales bacterium]